MNPLFLDTPRTRPLHLSHGTGWRVQLDGLALRVTAPRRAPGLVPLKAISRVISASDVQWEPRALLACMKAGTAITFIDALGNPQGYCHGVLRRETSLANLLVEVIEHPEWDQRYENWLTGMHSQRIIHALSNTGLRISFCDRAAARSKLCEAAHQRCQRNITALLRQIDGNLHALVLEQLQHAINHPRFLGHPRPGLSFVKDFANLLHWSAYSLLTDPETIGPIPDDEARLAAHLTNSHRAELQARIKAMLSIFELWLREWTQEDET